MNRKWMTRIGVSLLVLAGLAVVAGVAFRAGQHHDDVRNAVVGDDGVRTVVVTDGWRHGWPGFGFGFLFFPLLIVGLILLFSSRRAAWGGPWRGREEELRQWHQRAHAEEQTQVAQQAQPAQPMQSPQPPEPPQPPVPPSEA